MIGDFLWDLRKKNTIQFFLCMKQGPFWQQMSSDEDSDYEFSGSDDGEDDTLTISGSVEKRVRKMFEKEGVKLPKHPGPPPKGVELQPIKLGRPAKKQRPAADDMRQRRLQRNRNSAAKSRWRRRVSAWRMRLMICRLVAELEDRDA